jgi:hypothetical protein
MLVSLAGIIILANQEILSLGILNYLPEGGMLDAIKHHRDGFLLYSQGSRATYIIDTDFSSFYSTARTFFLMYIHFLLAPFPWQIEGFIDVYAFMEGVLRVVLIYFSVKHWNAAHGVQRRVLGLMLILFFSMSFMWAVGTSNYGTGARHHMLDWWIISIAGTPMLIRMLSRLRLR